MLGRRRAAPVGLGLPEWGGSALFADEKERFIPAYLECNSMIAGMRQSVFIAVAALETRETDQEYPVRRSTLHGPEHKRNPPRL